ncbi:hypothetical protein AAU57_09355 [Nonlabens sp. YIK11]|uniref:hypothetical protein n=1 Tax=Nonlabens sp. YIK11 TaxID=1453349 RepID=UPI0006DC3E3C|nr:hypothetical protein [Nonlabens sp. YIK11]KQC33497.1 hypothetical protein AAU57_09355 [Nonlabens sp. YIK11]
MDIIKYLLNKKVYLLINLIILFVGYMLIEKGVELIKEDPTKSNILVSIGTSVIATGIVVFLDLWKTVSISKLMERIKNIINEGGLNLLYKKRDIDRYDDLIKDLDTSLDICGYSLGGFFDSNSVILREKLTNKNIKVRALFVDYNSESAKIRAQIEGKSIDLFRTRFETFKNYFDQVSGIEIRIIQIPLSSMIYRIDNTMFVGPHFYKRQSKSTLTMELKKGKWMFDEYQNEFERMWNDAQPV